MSITKAVGMAESGRYGSKRGAAIMDGARGTAHQQGSDATSGSNLVDERTTE